MPQPVRSLVLVRSMDHVPGHVGDADDVDVVLVAGPDAPVDAPDTGYDHVVVVAGGDSPAELRRRVDQAAGLAPDVLVAATHAADADTAAWRDAFDGWEALDVDPSFRAVRVRQGGGSTAGPFLHGWASALPVEEPIDPEPAETLADTAPAEPQVAPAPTPQGRGRRLLSVVRARRRLVLVGGAAAAGALVVSGVLGAVVGDVYLALLGTLVLLVVAAAAVRSEQQSRRLLARDRAREAQLKSLSRSVSPEATEELRRTMRALELSHHEMVHRLGRDV